MAESNHSHILLWGYFWGCELVTAALRYPERADDMTSSIPPLGIALLPHDVLPRLRVAASALARRLCVTDGQRICVG